MKIRPVGAEMLRADRRTDMTKLIFAFRNVANAPKNVLHVNLCFDFLYNFCLKHFSETNRARYDHKCVLVFT